MKNLDLRLFKDYDTTLIGRGFTLAQEGHVRILQRNDTQVTAQVMGSNVYDVEISLMGKKPVDFRCNCPFPNKMCKHIAAVLVWVDEGVTNK